MDKFELGVLYIRIWGSQGPIHPKKNPQNPKYMVPKMEKQLQLESIPN